MQVGLPIGTATPPLIPMARVAAWELELVGSHGMGVADFVDVLELVAQGKLQPQALVEREVSLEEGAQAIMALEQGSPVGITMVTTFT